MSSENFIPVGVASVDLGAGADVDVVEGVVEVEVGVVGVVVEGVIAESIALVVDFAAGKLFTSNLGIGCVVKFISNVKFVDA
jgi:hypothetical protein